MQSEINYSTLKTYLLKTGKRIDEGKVVYQAANDQRKVVIAITEKISSFL